MKNRLVSSILVLLILALVVGCSNNNPVYSPTTQTFGKSWHHQNPIPTSNTLYDVEYLSDNEILIVGWPSLLLHSNNGGFSWKESYPFPNTALDLSLIEGQFGWAVGVNGMIMYTSNGGKIWQEQTSGISSNLLSVFFTDRSHGWAVGIDGVILKTVDDGQNWRTMRIGSVFAFDDVFFIDNQNGWVVGRSNLSQTGDAIYRTQNGGETWQNVDVGIPALIENPDPNFGDEVYVSLRAVAARDIDNIAIIGVAYHGGSLGGIVIETQDGGQNWNVKLTETRYADIQFIEGNGSMEKERKLLEGSSLLSMDFNDSRNGCAVGYEGYLFLTVDGGETWQEQNNNYRRTINSLFFLDSLHGWAAGYDGLIKTTDGGLNWEKTNNTADQSVEFVDFYTGWTCDLGGNLDITIDGGVNWLSVKVPWQMRVNDMDFIDSKTGWICGYEYILRTDDGGHTWKDQWWTGRLGPDLRGIIFVDSLHGWSAGSEGTLLRTVDGGWNWTKQILPNVSTLQDIFFIDSLNGWAVGQSRYVFYTKDGGVIWQTSEEITDLFGFTSVMFVDNLNGWITGSAGKIFRSNDGGRSWQQKNTHSAANLMSIWAVDSNKVWAAGRYGTILHSSNGGQ